MSTTTTTRPTLRRRTGRRVGLAATAAIVVFTMAACMNADQQTAFDHVNNSRTYRSIPALVHDATAQSKAQAWAEHLASRNTLAHSNLRDGMDDQWTKLAENVGYGSSIGSVHSQFMGSSEHRGNILDRSFTHVGVGVAHAHGRTFVVQVFSRR
ncbi:MAG: CAP domain-containing protein [Acidimicrobiales bacterium]|nr:CAP domain-containing protein [Acidimicrobiales bacterium]